MTLLRSFTGLWINPGITKKYIVILCIHCIISSHFFKFFVNSWDIIKLIIKYYKHYNIYGGKKLSRYFLYVKININLYFYIYKNSYY